MLLPRTRYEIRWRRVVVGIGVGRPDRSGGDLRRPGSGKAAGGGRADDAEGSGALPELKVDKGAPLLLDSLPDAKPEKTPDEGPVADNSACYCCHRNYEEEAMVQEHAKANVGCVKCHGESIAHRNDEDNITPPDVIYASDQIEKACQKCHDIARRAGQEGDRRLAAEVPGQDPRRGPALHRLPRRPPAEDSHGAVGQAHAEARLPTPPRSA